MSVTAPRSHALPATAQYLGRHDPQQELDITLVLRRRGAAPTPAVWPAKSSCTRANFAALAGADPADIARLRAFASAHELRETACEPHRRTLHIRAPAHVLERVFGVQLGHYRIGSDGAPFVASDTVPTAPDEAVIAVLGLDRRPVARAHARRPMASPSHTYTPPQLGQLYGFPAGDGGGQCVAIIELGGGYASNDLQTHFRGLGISPPTITAVPVAGGGNQPGSDSDGEVMLDIEVVGALVPAADIAVYFAPNTDQGFFEAISQAAHDTTHRPSVISISWGGPESNWSGQARDAMQSALEDAANLGITVTVAAGDSGSSDGVSDGQPHVDFPASSPYALGCGGTKLVASQAIQSELVWNETAAGEGATGGGVSTLFARPSWQQQAKVPAASGGSGGRGVPDVAGAADPLTGYRVRVDGQDQVIGGTSAVAPLWAALIARFNQLLGQPLGHPHATFYAIGSAGFRDITQGDNGQYQAGVGWDACTGLGSPNGSALLAALQARQPSA